MPRRGRLNEQQREQLRRAYLEVGESTAGEIPDSFEGRAAFEQERLSRQIVDGVEGFMRDHGVSQQELARTLGVSEGRVSQVLSGEQNLTLKTLAGLAAALGGHFHISFERTAEGDRAARAGSRAALPAAERTWGRVSFGV